MNEQIITAAWERIKAARAEWHLATEDDEASEQTCWKVCDREEDLICATNGGTARSAEVHLWLALLHTVTTRSEDAMAIAEDIEAFSAHESEMDWNVRLMLAAIRELRAMKP